MISRENYKQVTKFCAGQELKKCMRSSGRDVCSAECQVPLRAGILSADKAALNPYNIYGDVCLLENGQANALHYRSLDLPRIEIGPCQDKFTRAYLQLHVVQSAIHVSGNHVEWSDCNHQVSRMYKRSPSALPKYPAILAAGLCDA
jgi:serine carboxypeptidase-like clade 2